MVDKKTTPEEEPKKEPKKRGRKRTSNLYFGPEQEEAVAKYVFSGTSDSERNLIYNAHLLHPLNKLVESIIRTYGLYRKGHEYTDIHKDTLSYLVTKASKFDPAKGTRAYSYYGTVCKNYLIGLLQKDQKQLEKFSSYEDSYDDLNSDERLSYNLEDGDFKLDDFIIVIVREVSIEMLEEDNTKKKLTENERRVGYGLIEILESWETIFDDMKGGAKFNKNQWLETMRNITHLSTKDIRIGMKRYKVMYEILKQDGLDNGLT